MQIYFWRYIKIYNTVGIDIVSGKSTVTVLQPVGTVIRKPFDISSHISQSLNELADYLVRYQGRYGMYRKIFRVYSESFL